MSRDTSQAAIYGTSPLGPPRFASTLRAGETITYRGTQVEILRDREPCTDILGRTMFHFWARRLDTGAEGWLMFGEGGVVV